MEKIKLGISQCLLGEKVRYDGGHKLDRYLRDTLGQFVEWVPVCPEHECGLPIPREAMHLVQAGDQIQLKTIKTHVDITPQMNRWMKKKINQLKKENLCGFIFKSKSPSSGMQGVKIYHENGQPLSKKGVGVFAKSFMDAFPLLPVEDEGRLHDNMLRENFIERIFVYHRFMTLGNSKLKDLVNFHTVHKLLIMSHNQLKVSQLGRLVANAKGNLKEIKELYFNELMNALKTKTNVKKNVNVLSHILGYFKKHLDSSDKHELISVIENYHKGLVPLVVPITMIQHYVRKFDVDYLKDQVYLNPHPFELMLRNHV